jgi:trk system potassium uptake protein TrkH
MRFSVVIHVIGVVVRLFGLMFLAPLALALADRDSFDAQGFAIGLVVTVVLGHAMRHAGGRQAEAAVESMRRVEGLAVVAASWLLIAALAGIPYLWNGVGVIDSTFQAMSGLTTTSATIIRDFSLYSRSVIFWHALTNWLGGMGVIALFVAVLPRLAIGGRELFFAEAPGHDDEKVAPQIRRTAALLWRLYAGLTVLEIVALVITGMPLFDSICNSFGTIASAGFSPHPLSIAGYQNPAAEWVIIVFMFLSGANFALQYRALVRRDWRVFGDDEELRAYAGVAVVATMVLALTIYDTVGSGEAFRTALFHAVSFLTTTGFASADLALWSDQAKAVLLGLMFIGGCSGSAAGGPKVVRHLLLARFTLQELRRTLHPRAILPVKLGGRVVPVQVLQGVIVFFLFYMLTFAVVSAIVILLGADLVTGISVTAATLGSVGIGFNDAGQMVHFADLHPVSRVVLMLTMWIGRLEVITVLVILRPEAWRAGRWSSSDPHTAIEDPTRPST